ncbi:MAG TPA: Gldg family protein [Vicinamibacterales bacterium]|jgi:ABC-type uncharacterized transport system involved in gliding motility auxiliary subunit|nr:Gldg family protein [Vicinamibacterales bacterium]
MLKRILGIVGWIGTALVFAAVAVRFLRPEWDRYAVYAAWGGLACVVLYTLGQWRDIFAFFHRRQARYGALATAGVLVALGVVVAVNYLSTRQNKRWDLTANKQHSLSEQTVKLLRNLDAPVKFLVFDRSTDFDRFRTRLDEYKYHSNRVSVEYIDPDTKPVQAKEYAIQSYGTVVVEYKDRKEHTTSDSEQDLTNALIKAMTGQQKKVYFVQGHGEKDPVATEREGYSGIVAALGKDNYGTEKLVLAQQKDVPADASVVVVAGPKSDLLPGEVDMLRRYLNKGGHLLVLLDPDDVPGTGKPALEALLKEWAIDAGQNIVVDVSGMGQLLGTDASVPVAAKYPTHPITDHFNLLTAFPLARSVAPASGGTNGRYAQSIIETSERSWAETNVKQLRANGEVALNVDEGDKQGPVSIGAAVSAPAPDAPAPATDAAKASQKEEPKKPEARLAVIGDSDFAANFALGIQGNRDLFANTVNWLAQQENLIAIRPKEARDRRVMLTANQQTGVFWMSLLLIPAAVLGAGVYNWWRRR